MCDYPGPQEEAVKWTNGQQVILVTKRGGLDDGQPGPLFTQVIVGPRPLLSGLHAPSEAVSVRLAN